MLLQAWRPRATPTTPRPPPLCPVPATSCSWRPLAGRAPRWPLPRSCRSAAGAFFAAQTHGVGCVAGTARGSKYSGTARIVGATTHAPPPRLAAARLALPQRRRAAVCLLTRPPTPCPRAVGAARGAGQPAAHPHQCGPGPHGWRRERQRARVQRAQVVMPPRVALCMPCCPMARCASQEPRRGGGGPAVNNHIPM